MTEPAAQPEPPPSWLKVVGAVNAALDKRGVKLQPCAVCGGKDTFALSNGYFVASLSRKGTEFAMGGNGMPLLSLFCQRCGHTVFLNSLLLGLGNDLFDEVAPNASA